MNIEHRTSNSQHRMVKGGRKHSEFVVQRSMFDVRLFTV